MLRNIPHPRKNRKIKILKEDPRLSYTRKYIYIYIHVYVKFKSSRRIIFSPRPTPLFLSSASSFTLNPSSPPVVFDHCHSKNSLPSSSPFPSHVCTIHGTRSHRPMRNAWRDAEKNLVPGFISRG